MKETIPDVDDSVLEREKKRGDGMASFKTAMRKKRQFEEKGERLEIFDKNKNVLSALLNNKAINNHEGKSINIKELCKDPKARFVALDAYVTSLAISTILSNIYQEGRKEGVQASFEAGYHAGLKTGYNKAVPLNEETIRLGKEKRIQNADDHAKKMYEIFQTSNEIVNSKSSRAIAKVLNDQNVSTARGGQWHAQTVQDLYKRWEKLGLKSEPSPK